MPRAGWHYDTAGKPKWIGPDETCILCRGTGRSPVPFHDYGLCDCRFCRCPCGRPLKEDKPTRQQGYGRLG